MAEHVAIVGAGIVGIACAHYLAESGHTVTVIDQDRIGGGCSHGNAGHICASHVLPLNEPGNLRAALLSLVNPRAPFRVRPQWRPELFRWFWEFARRCNHRHALVAGRALKSILDASAREYEALFQGGGLDAGWQPLGLLYVLRTRRGMERFAAQDAMLRDAFGVGATRLEGSELVEFDPALRPGLAGGFHYEGDAFLRPDALTANWAGFLKRRGVIFEESRRLLSVETAGGKITRLVTDAGEETADHYVFALGAWSTEFAADLDCPIPVEPGKGYSITTTRPGKCPRYALLFAEHRLAATPFEDGFRLGSMMEFAGFDATIPPRRIRQLVDSAKHYLHEPVGDRVLETWSGWRPMTWDSLPLIGRVPGLGNAVLATGHHMLGMTMAPATGRLVAEIIGERSTRIDPAPFSPARFS
ncbi:MAG: FAD-dependent oxidoreductase [Gammaproteobacteria bacterium]|nr:FAD-dependent oxidoreductase [Gammaproteobacteria bacterium]